MIVTKQCRYEECRKAIPSARPGQDFCSNRGKCRNAWHKSHNKAVAGIRGKIRSIRPVKGNEVSITIRLPAAEHGRAMNFEQGQEIGLIE